ncbi:hypothetical protein FFE93_002465 [Yersinia sp. KBS0713]|nr:hypothetical protein FFE93_002465 [Yersinia sp. KBS0713]
MVLRAGYPALKLMTNPTLSQMCEGATAPRGASVAYATTTPTEHSPFNQFGQWYNGWLSGIFMSLSPPPKIL